ncbi:hypothetical protein VTG60DRAFT_367 [Thermothelomyces hinnuleus]
MRTQVIFALFAALRHRQAFDLFCVKANNMPVTGGTGIASSRQLSWIMAARLRQSRRVGRQLSRAERGGPPCLFRCRAIAAVVAWAVLSASLRPRSWENAYLTPCGDSFAAPFHDQGTVGQVKNLLSVLFFFSSFELGFTENRGEWPVSRPQHRNGVGRPGILGMYGALRHWIMGR